MAVGFIFICGWHDHESNVVRRMRANVCCCAPCRLVCSPDQRIECRCRLHFAVIVMRLSLLTSLLSLVCWTILFIFFFILLFRSLSLRCFFHVFFLLLLFRLMFSIIIYLRSRTKPDVIVISAMCCIKELLWRALGDWLSGCFVHHIGHREAMPRKFMNAACAIAINVER